MTNQSTIPNDAAIIYASLDQLYLHDLNPRQNVAQKDVETLADSIRMRISRNLGSDFTRSRARVSRHLGQPFHDHGQAGRQVS